MVVTSCSSNSCVSLLTDVRVAACSAAAACFTSPCSYRLLVPHCLLLLYAACCTTCCFWILLAVRIQARFTAACYTYTRTTCCCLGQILGCNRLSTCVEAHWFRSQRIWIMLYRIHVTVSWSYIRVKVLVGYRPPFFVGAPWDCVFCFAGWDV